MTSIDFTPLWYVRRRQVRGIRRRRLLYLAVLSGLMCCWWTVNRGMMRSAQAALQVASAGQQELQIMRANVDRLGAEQQRLETQLRRFRSMAEQLHPTVVFAEISHMLPDDARVERFLLEQIDWLSTTSNSRRPGAGGAREQARHSGCRVTLVAQARDNATLLQLCLNLQGSPLFEFTDFHDIHTTEIVGGSIEQRQIDLYVLRAEHIE